MHAIKQICICGGGGLGHTCAAALSSKSGVEVSLYTRRPEQWQHTFLVHAPNGKDIHGHLAHISSNPKDLIPQADMVLLCLPAFLVEQAIATIRPYLQQNTIVGAIVGNSGFFIFCHNLLPNTTKLFAFQRVPFISRVITYGKEACLLGYKDQLLIATENIPDNAFFCREMAYLFDTLTELLSSFYEVTLSNSNPILHTGRLYTLWKNWDGTPYASNPLFYHDWTDEASALEIEMDKEFFALLDALQVNTQHIDTLLHHYESTDASSMTAKLRSIESLSAIPSPMKQVQSGWVPDFTSRYFTEDFPFGLRFIYELLHQHHIPCPNIDKVYTWGLKQIQPTK